MRLSVLRKWSAVWQQFSTHGKGVSRLMWEVAGSKFPTVWQIWTCSSGKERLSQGMELKGRSVIKVSLDTLKGMRVYFWLEHPLQILGWTRLHQKGRWEITHHWTEATKLEPPKSMSDIQCKNIKTKWKNLVMVFFFIFKIQKVIKYSGEQELN